MVKIGWSLASSWMRRKYFWPHCGRCESLAWRVGQAGVDLCRASKGEVFGSSPHICCLPQLQELLPSRKPARSCIAEQYIFCQGTWWGTALMLLGEEDFLKRAQIKVPSSPIPSPCGFRDLMEIPWDLNQYWQVWPLCEIGFDQYPMMTVKLLICLSPAIAINWCGHNHNHLGLSTLPFLTP